MARRPRLDLAGFHHIVNRGVARGNVYKSSIDKDKFLEILCKACKDYRVNVHDYCLMDNHYHLLIETTSQNLSLFMRQINSNYAIYYNKKYNRSGHLWQGRFGSWYITQENYLYRLFKYIEHNPIEAKISTKIGEYPYTLVATLLNKNLSMIPCAKNSKLKKEFVNISDFLEAQLNNEDIKMVNDIKKLQIVESEYGYKKLKSISLQEHFKDIDTIKYRNIAVMKALEDGYKQAEIARFLGFSETTISKIKKKMNGA